MSLLPCPFCSSEDVGTRVEFGQMFIVCHECGGQGGSVKFDGDVQACETMAIAMWQERKWKS